MWQHIERARIEAKPEAIWSRIADVASHDHLAGSGEVRSVALEGPVEPGTWFTSTIDVGETRPPFESRNRIDVVEANRELRWVSYPPLDPGETPEHQLEVTWWFKLTPGKGETAVEHGFRLPNPRAGAAELAAFIDRTGRMKAVAHGMRQTLENLRDAVER